MPSNCGICSLLCSDDDNEQVIKCAGSCEKSFHSRCIQDDVVGAKTRSFRDWKCKNCRTSININSSSTPEATNDLLKALADFKAQIMHEFKSAKDEINTLAQAVQYASDKMDESMTLMKEIKSDLAAVKKENENLRSMNTTLSNEVNILKDKVRSLEQYSRKNNVEINGIPETPRENVFNLVKDVGTALGLDIQDSDISTAHRVPSFKKDRPPPLIVQFSRRITRDTLLSKFRDKKSMTAQEINPALTFQRVYINEHLTPENKLFLKTLKEKCKEASYDYAWCRDGKFFVRKCQGERVHRVTSCEDLNKLK